MVKGIVAFGVAAALVVAGALWVSSDARPKDADQADRAQQQGEATAAARASSPAVEESRAAIQSADAGEKLLGQLVDGRSRQSSRSLTFGQAVDARTVVSTSGATETGLGAARNDSVVDRTAAAPAAISGARSLP